MPASFNTNFGTTVRASHIKQIINAWSGIANSGVPFNLVTVSDSTTYAATIRNLSTGGALRVQNAAGTNLLLVNETGLTLGGSLSSVTSLGITQGTITADAQALSATTTWNSGAVTFTAWKLNVTDTASAAASLLLDLQVGSTSQWKVTKAGATTQLGGATVTGALTFTTNAISTTALATPSALSATQSTLFASTVSGATLMGYGTTGDVTLKNRAGTDVLVVTSNTLNLTAAGALAITGALSGVTTVAASGLITSTATTGMIASATATATPGAYSATQSTLFASTVSGATLMGYGTTGDVTLKNRAGTDVIVVTSNTLNVTMAGALAITGALSGVTTVAASGLITSTATTGIAASATATATPSAYSATQATFFASTVSGATLMGYGTTGDVTLKNRAGTDVLVVTSNTLNVTMAGALAITGALSGVTTLSASGIVSLKDGTAASLALNFTNETGLGFFRVTGNVLGFAIGNAQTMQFGNAGIFLGGTASRATTDPTNALNLFNGTAPVGTLANGCTLYSAAGFPKFMDAAGNVYLLSTAATLPGSLAITGALSGATTGAFSGAVTANNSSFNTSTTVGTAAFQSDISNNGMNALIIAGLTEAINVYTAQQTTPAHISVRGDVGSIAFYTDSGKTIGNTYTPTQRLSIDSAGAVTINTGPLTVSAGGITVVGSNGAPTPLVLDPGATANAGEGLSLVARSNGAGTRRTWNIQTDVTVAADFVIRQSTAEAGSSWNNALYFDASRVATFSAGDVAVGATRVFSGTSGVSVGTGATTILTTDQPGGANTGLLTVVTGLKSDNGGITFVDLVLWMYGGGTPTVISSQTQSTPANRTYSISASANLQLAMSANTYLVTACGIRPK